MMKSVLSAARCLALVAATAGLISCGGRKEASAPGGGGKPSGSKAADDVPTTNNPAVYVDHFRFGDAADADGVVVRETSTLRPGATAAISLYVRNVAPGTEVRMIWNDLATNTPKGELVKPIADKGFVTFKQASPLPEGSYRLNMSYKKPNGKAWENLGTHDFKVGNPG
jgi:hypothetical protein